MTRGRRHLWLPDEGTLLVSTDLHGNFDDFSALRDRFLEGRRRREDLYWLSLGDLVHGPDEQAREDLPELYDFDDRSWEIVESFSELRAEHPERVHLLLGNHDRAHIGGPAVRKLYPDEAAHLEAGLDSEQRRLLRDLFEAALLVAYGRCGLVFTHGSPGDVLLSAADLEDLSFDPVENDDHRNRLLASVTTSYGQASEVTERFLPRLSASVSLDLHLVVHGHDRELDGWFVEGDNQLCPVLFGAFHHEKRYLEVDLGGTYREMSDLRDGAELRRLHLGGVVSS